MGREIRRVPANWEHPRRNCQHSPWNGGCKEAKKHNGQCYRPMYDKDFDTALSEWLSGYELWKNGKHPHQLEYPETALSSYFEYEGAPPDPEYYRPVFENANWYQMYQTVSEGTPVTPPFATKEELVDYLVLNGDFWDQERGDGGWLRENAESFVERGWAMSGVIIVQNGNAEIKAPRDGA
jgi:hypothetical protein